MTCNRLSWQQRREAVRLYLSEEYSLKELEIKFNKRMTYYDIPRTVREERAEKVYALERHQREQEIKREKKKEYNRRYQAKRKKRIDKQVQKEAKQKKHKTKVKAMSNKLRQFSIESVKINIKQCPVNNWLMRS